MWGWFLYPPNIQRILQDRIYQILLTFYVHITEHNVKTLYAAFLRGNIHGKVFLFGLYPCAKYPRESWPFPWLFPGNCGEEYAPNRKTMTPRDMMAHSDAEKASYSGTIPWRKSQVKGVLSAGYSATG